jgi:hypothetical protein
VEAQRYLGFFGVSRGGAVTTILRDGRFGGTSGAGLGAASRGAFGAKSRGAFGAKSRGRFGPGAKSRGAFGAKSRGAFGAKSRGRFGPGAKSRGALGSKVALGSGGEVARRPGARLSRRWGPALERRNEHARVARIGLAGRFGEAARDVGRYLDGRAGAAHPNRADIGAADAAATAQHGDQPPRVGAVSFTPGDPERDPRASVTLVT